MLYWKWHFSLLRRSNFRLREKFLKMASPRRGRGLILILIISSMSISSINTNTNTNTNTQDNFSNEFSKTAIFQTQFSLLKTGHFLNKIASKIAPRPPRAKKKKKKVRGSPAHTLTLTSAGAIEQRRPYYFLCRRLPHTRLPWPRPAPRAEAAGEEEGEEEGGAQD